MALSPLVRKLASLYSGACQPQTREMHKVCDSVFLFLFSDARFICAFAIETFASG